MFRTSYVAFQTEGDRPLTVAGKLRTPLRTDMGAPEKVPAVLICHGSDGVDARGAFHGLGFEEAGIVTLEIDMWAARGSARGANARPKSPLENLADVFAAKKFLAQQPEVDPQRIGILGFSWGGVLALLSATSRAVAAFSRGEPPFAAHVAFYPVCWAYGRVPGLSLDDLAGAPIQIQTGDADTYDDPDGLTQLLDRLPENARRYIQGITHAGAGHAFDRDAPATTIVDPFAHKGAGGPVPMVYHPEAAARARDLAVGFFREAFGKTASAKQNVLIDVNAGGAG